MYKLQLILTIYFLFVVTNVFTQPARNQMPTVLKSVLTQAGSRAVSYEYANADGVVKTTKIQQTIGQNGAVGSSNISNHSVQQGFLNRVKLLNVDNTTVEFVETMDLIIRKP